MQWAHGTEMNRNSRSQFNSRRASGRSLSCEWRCFGPRLRAPAGCVTHQHVFTISITSTTGCPLHCHRRTAAQAAGGRQLVLTHQRIAYGSIAGCAVPQPFDHYHSNCPRTCWQTSFFVLSTYLCWVCLLHVSDAWQVYTSFHLNPRDMCLALVEPELADLWKLMTGSLNRVWRGKETQTFVN